MTDDITALIEQGNKLADDLDDVEGNGSDFGIMSSIRAEQIAYYRGGSATMLRLMAQVEALEDDIVTVSLRSHERGEEIARLREALITHHHWHLETGVILKIPTGDGDFVELDNAEEYADSALYEQTAIALSPSQDPEPCPKCGGVNFVSDSLGNPVPCDCTGKKESAL